LAPRQVPFFHIFTPWVPFGSRRIFSILIDPELWIVKWWWYPHDFKHHRKESLLEMLFD